MNVKKVFFILIFLMISNKSMLGTETEAKIDGEIKIDHEVTNYYLSVCSYSGVVEPEKLQGIKSIEDMYEKDLNHLISINHDFANEDYFVYVNANDHKLESQNEQKANVPAPAPQANNAPAQATRDLNIHGGFIDNPGIIRLKAYQFPSYLPLSLFIDSSTGKFKKEGEIVTIVLQNMELEDGNKKNILFELRLIQNNRFSDRRRLGNTIEVALDKLYQNYKRILLSEFPGDNVLFKDGKKIANEFLFGIDKMKTQTECDPVDQQND